MSTPGPQTRQPVAVRLDLRRTAFDDVVDTVERALHTRLERDGAVIKRRSAGFRSADRGTWVRIECRGIDRLDGQGWGLEAATVLNGLPIPQWYAGASWYDQHRQVMWRADETQLIDQDPVDRPATATGLPDSWWTEFDAALDGLAAVQTPRLATPDLEPITVERVHSAISKVFADTPKTIDQWTTSHADMTWANVTGPQLWLLDWEDWGRAPRGLDAATLWFSSLSVPELAERILDHRQEDLESATGRTMRLFKCAELLAWADPTEPLYAPARRAAEQLLNAINR